MSKEGIKIASEVFNFIQQSRERLMRLGCGEHNSGTARTADGQQDILLSQMLGRANDAVKDEFCRITSGKP